jgi:RimJ/RimL family protein N-acetyltransferase
MLNTLITHAKQVGLKLLILSVFSTNERARYVYEKVGFRECGRIPQRIFKNDRYIDEIVMVKTLTKPA